MKPTHSELRFRHPVPVRFRDIDIGGHAHHSVALSYFEEARTAYWREVAGRADDEIGYILAEATVRYKRRVLYPDTLSVALGVSELGKKHFRMAYEIFAGTGDLLVSGSTVQVMYDYEAGTTSRMSDDIRTRIVEHDGPFA